MISAIHLQVIVSGLLIGAVYALFASGLTLIALLALGVAFLGIRLQQARRRLSRMDA